MLRCSRPPGALSDRHLPLAGPPRLQRCSCPAIQLAEAGLTAHPLSPYGGMGGNCRTDQPGPGERGGFVVLYLGVAPTRQCYAHGQRKSQVKPMSTDTPHNMTGLLLKRRPLTMRSGKTKGVQARRLVPLQRL